MRRWQKPQIREIVLYVPVGGHRATAEIPRGAAVVGQPAIGDEEVVVCVEGDIHRLRMHSLADRALAASGRLLQGIGSTCEVPRDALVPVGTFDFAEARILLTGPQSARLVADWLGEPQLTRAQLQGKRLLGAPPLATWLDPSLLRALLKRGGIRSVGETWMAADGRQTAVIGDALMWALESIAQGR